MKKGESIRVRGKIQKDGRSFFMGRENHRKIMEEKDGTEQKTKGESAN